MGKTITLTIRELLFNNNFWQKVIQTPTTNDKAGYWINKLHGKILSGQREAGRMLTTFSTELGEKFGQKDKDGKVLMGPNGLPAPRHEVRDEYEDMFDEFAKTEVTVNSDKLPVEYFSHIQKTPQDWACLEAIAVIDENTLGQEKQPTNTRLSSVN